MTDENLDSPGVIAFPPLLYGGTFLLGLLLQLWAPLHPFPPVPARWIGGALLVGGAIVAKWGELTMKRAGTNVNPSQPTLAIVSGGPFRFSRNYLSLTIIYLGLTLLMNALWPLILMPALIAVVQWGVILREERYLEGKFGRAYREYRTRVRRWL